jgi:hypothetical protein
MSKSPKKLIHCQKIVETSSVLIVFDGVLSEVLAYTVTGSYRRSTWSRYKKQYIWVSNITQTMKFDYVRITRKTKLYVSIVSLIKTTSPKRYIL